MLITLLALAQATASPEMPAFLSGCWEQRRSDGGWTEECWTGPRGGLMIGSGRDGQGDVVRTWEWMRIEQGADASLTFHASPKGAAAVPFKVSERSATAITFVNASNEFPQRVRYSRTVDGLDAEISLLDGSKPVRWSYRRSGSPSKD